MVFVECTECKTVSVRDTGIKWGEANNWVPRGAPGSHTAYFPLHWVLKSSFNLIETSKHYQDPLTLCPLPRKDFKVVEGHRIIRGTKPKTLPASSLAFPSGWEDYPTLRDSLRDAVWATERRVQSMPSNRLYTEQKPLNPPSTAF